MAALVAHGDTIADFAVRAPSTAKILAALSPGSAGAAAAPTTEVLVLCLFLSVGCQSLPTGGSRLKQQPQTTKTSTADGSFKLSGETVHGLTASAFVQQLRAKSGTVATVRRRREARPGPAPGPAQALR